MVTDILFLAVPLVALFCNLFLFLTLIGSFRNRVARSFLYLLVGFILWTAGSLLMRIPAYPGVEFWNSVSILGIFTVPFLVYNFFYRFTGTKGSFLRFLWLVLWVVVIVMNFFGLFLTNPNIVEVDGYKTFTFDVSILAIIPVVLAALTLANAVYMIVKTIRNEHIPLSVFTPIFTGLIIMFVGVVALTVFRVKWLSSDSLFCGINAICLYYSLYKKRIVKLPQIAAPRATYFMALFFVAVTAYIFYEPITSMIGRAFTTQQSRFMAIALGFSLVTMLLNMALRFLMGKLFVKNQQVRDSELKTLTQEVNRTLDIREITAIYQQFIQKNFNSECSYICTPTDDGSSYIIANHSELMKDNSFSISSTNPLVAWLKENNQATLYHDFTRTGTYKSMWENEKAALNGLDVQLIVPICSDGVLSAITLFTNKKDKKHYTYGEIDFLEAAAGVVSIAYKNASLYESLCNEARRDSLTGLYNRSYFMSHLDDSFKSPAFDRLTIMILSFDDFRLFNELYGTVEADDVLVRFGEILKATVGHRGNVARFSGKEFIVRLPFLDSSEASKIADACRDQLNNYLHGFNEKSARFLTFSTGICSYPAAASNAKELVSFANMALQNAKHKGKNRNEIFTKQFSSQAEIDKRKYEEKRELSSSFEPTIYALCAAIDAKDHYTFNHSNNVSRYAVLLAQAIGLNPEHVEIIRQAGLLHDIGKIGIPDRILSKKERLTSEEYEIMKQHVEGSINMIRHLNNLEYVIPPVLSHHERWDGKGYPRGVSGISIPIGGRCLGIADAFDAMTTKRSYRDPLPIDFVLNEIRSNLGTQFDPKLGQVFIELVENGTITVDYNK